MMFVSPHLAFNPLRSLPRDLEWPCDMQADIPPEINLETFRAGQWWVYPLARSGGTQIVALLLTPGVALAHSPVVVAQAGQAITIASSPAYLIPIRLHEKMVRGGQEWDELAATPAKTWKALVALHHTFGGKGELEELRKLLGDKRIKKTYEASDFRALMSAYAESQQRLDQAPETATYTSYLLQAASQKVAPTPTPEAGCWNAALASLALFVNQHDEDTPRRDEEQWAAWQVAHHLPGLDTSRSGNGIVVDCSIDAADELNVSAAKVVTKRKRKEWASDLLVPAIEKLATTKKYSGAAHRDAAVALETARDYPAAFRALAAAAHWQARAAGTADGTDLDAARKLARRAGWLDIADALDSFHNKWPEIEAEDG
jgi:hypothetical protein